MRLVAAREQRGNSGLAGSTGLLHVESTGPLGLLAWDLRIPGPLERLAFEVGEIEERLAALEQRAWLPSSAELQRARHEAIRQLRAEGLVEYRDLGADSHVLSQVGDLVTALPTLGRVTALNGNSSPARRSTAKRRRSIERGAWSPVAGRP